jgi:hypothetical protein
LEAEGEVISPAVKGMSRAQRDEVLKSLGKAIQGYLAACCASVSDSALTEKKEAAVEELLRRLEWRKQEASWSTEWWGKDECWVAPWLDDLGKRTSPRYISLPLGRATDATAPYLSTVNDKKDPVPGRDFFWTLQSLAQFPSLAGDVPESVFLSRPAYAPTNAVINAEKRARAEAQLKRLVMNEKRPFASDKLGLLLVATGWKVLKQQNKTVVYVPWWKTSTVKGNALGKHVSGQDFFVWEDSRLTDHLEVWSHSFFCISSGTR